MPPRARPRTETPSPARRSYRPCIEPLEVRRTLSASQLVVTSPPPSTLTAGTSFAMSISAEDASGNVDTSFTGNVTVSGLSNPGGAVTVAAVAGVADFSRLQLDTAANTVLSVATTSTGVSGTQSPPIAVNAATATHLIVVSPPPATVTAGATFGMVLAEADPFGNVFPGTTGTVTVALSGGGSLSGQVNVPFSNGLAPITALSLDTSGTGYQIVALSAGLSPTGGIPLTVQPASASQMIVTSSPPASVVAGQTFGLSVAIEDQYGNRVAGYSGNLAVAASSPQAEGTLGGPLTASVSGGVGTFSGLSLVNAGTDFTLQVSASGLTSLTTAPLTVTAGTVAKLVVTTPPPGDVTAGTGFGLVVAAEDPYGNVNASFPGTVTVALTTNPGRTALGGSATEPFNAGLATFTGLTMDIAADGYAMQAASSSTDTPTSMATGSFPVDVKAGAATQLVALSPPPSSVIAGAAFELVLAAEDPYGNIDPTYTGSATLALSSNPGGGTFGGSTIQGFSNGLATFAGLTVSQPGTGYTLQASSVGLSPSASLGLLTFSVTPAPAASQLVIITPPPGRIVAGTTFGFSVAAEDAKGNVDTAFNGGVVIGLSSNPTGGVLGGATSAQLTNGVASFSSLTLDQAGTGYTIQAASGGLAPSNTPAFVVTAASASQLVVTTQPPAAVDAGAPFNVNVSVEDQYGNTVVGYAGNLAIAPTNSGTEGSLGGPLTAPVIGGVASFGGLSVPNAGSPFTLQVTGSGLPPVTTSPFSVAAAGTVITTPTPTPTPSPTSTTPTPSPTTTTTAPSGGSSTTPVATPYLAISAQPTIAESGRYFDLTIEVDTAQGAPDLSYAALVTLAMAGGPPGAMLGGTLTMPVQQGLATFYGLILETAGAGYTIRASAPGFAPAATAPITVFDPPAALAFVGPPPTIGSGRSFGLTVDVLNASGSPASTYNGPVTITLIGHRGRATSREVRTLTAVNGLVSFTGLVPRSISRGSTLILQVSADGLNSATIDLSTAILHHPARKIPRREIRHR